MNITKRLRFVALILCGALMAASVFAFVGCNDPKNSPDQSTDQVETVVPTVLGTGNTVFSFGVVDIDGKETVYEIHTDKTLVGDALLELGLIAGDPGPYGLYVKTVGGIRADYDKDGTYWAFYENGKYALAGVDQTTITPGTIYSFRAEKG